MDPDDEVADARERHIVHVVIAKNALQRQSRGYPHLAVESYRQLRIFTLACISEHAKTGKSCRHEPGMREGRGKKGK
jgi:hypothetical protein